MEQHPLTTQLNDYRHPTKTTIAVRDNMASRTTRRTRLHGLYDIAGTPAVSVGPRYTPEMGISRPTGFQSQYNVCLALWGRVSILCHSLDTLSGMAREDPHWLVVLHGDEKSAGVLPKGTFSPGWSVGTASSAVGFADKEASLSPPAFTQFFRPSYVVDGSSPKQPRKGGGRGSG